MEKAVLMNAQPSQTLLVSRTSGLQAVFSCLPLFSVCTSVFSDISLLPKPQALTQQPLWYLASCFKNLEARLETQTPWNIHLSSICYHFRIKRWTL